MQVVIKNDNKVVFEGSLYQGSIFLGKPTNYLHMAVSRGKLPRYITYDVYVDGVKLSKKVVKFKKYIEVGDVVSFRGCDYKVIRIVNSEDMVSVMLSHHVDLVDTLTFKKLPLYSALFKAISRKLV